MAGTAPARTSDVNAPSFDEADAGVVSDAIGGSTGNAADVTHASWCMSRKGCNCAPTQPVPSTSGEGNTNE